MDVQPPWSPAIRWPASRRRLGATGTAPRSKQLGRRPGPRPRPPAGRRCGLPTPGSLGQSQTGVCGEDRRQSQALARHSRLNAIHPPRCTEQEGEESTKRLPSVATGRLGVARDVTTWEHRLWVASASKGAVEVVAWRTRKPARRAHGVAEGSNTILDGTRDLNALHTTVETAGKDEDIVVNLGSVKSYPT